MDEFEKRYWQLRKEGEVIHWSKISDLHLLEFHPSLCFMIYDGQAVFWNGHDGEFQKAMNIRSRKEDYCDKCSKN